MSIWKWADWLSPASPESRLTLGEGNTAVVRSRRIGPDAGLANLHFKLETGNPTGSYKDRFAAAAVTDMISRGIHRCIATSSGNTGSALAAYCAVARIPCHIAVVETAPQGKLSQMLAYGADIFKVKDFGIDPGVTTDTFELLCRLGEQPKYALQISAFKHSPIGMTGVQTISYELAEQFANQFSGPIDHVFCPAGGGGLTLAVARGFALLVEKGKLPRSPRIECVQPDGNNTMAGPLRRGDVQGQSVQCTSGISGLQVPSIIDADEVVSACRASEGTGHLVSDEQVWTMQRRLAREEGIFCEPAGAVALAGALQAAKQGDIQRDATIVCLVTGSGFKDDTSIAAMIQDRVCPVLDLADIERRLA